MYPRNLNRPIAHIIHLIDNSNCKYGGNNRESAGYFGGMEPRRVGVEEELLLVDPDDGRALAVSSKVLRRAVVHGQQPDGEGLCGEFTRQQIETNTRP